MEQTLDAFLADGGSTTFVDRISTQLSTDPKNVKIMSVYEGSLVVNYGLEVPDQDDKKLEALKNT